MRLTWLFGLVAFTGTLAAGEPTQENLLPAAKALIELAQNPRRQIPVAASSQSDEIPTGAVVRLSRQEMNVDEIIGPHTAIVFGRNIWIDGISTDTLSEDNVILMGPSIIWYCHGNKQYRTVIGGTKTVKHLEVIASPRIVAKANEVLLEDGKRVWVYSVVDRRTRVESIRFAAGEFTRQVGSRVHITTRKGKEITLRFPNLSESDREFVTRSSVSARAEDD